MNREVTASPVWTELAGGLLMLCVLSLPAAAEVRLDGWLIATASCPAYQSIRKQTNPGGVHTEAERAYVMIAKNKHLATHYLIEIGSAKAGRRWVETGCGIHVVAAGGAVVAHPQPTPTPAPSPVPIPKPQPPAPHVSGPDYVLAASWQPGFCETRPSKDECRDQTADRYDATHFALHGLWPQPRTNVYCNVAPAQVAADKASRWDDLPAVVLEADLRAALDKVMPGTRSLLDRHEWIKHGTCHGGTVDDYFADSLQLMEALNGSPVRDLFAAHIGRKLSADDIRDAFDLAFGAGAGERVNVICVQDGSRRLIGEITIGLSGELTADASFADLVFAAAPTSAGCSEGIVDAVGLQ